MNKENAYQNLVRRAGEITLLNGAAGILWWDQAAYMPPKAVKFRSEQQAYLAGQVHRLFTAGEVGDWIKTCEDGGFDRDSDELANVREWRRTYDRAVKLPVEFVEELRKTSALAKLAWVQARRESKFATFQPFLEKIVGLNRRAADLWGYEESPYDALLEEYEPGMRAAQIQKLFAELRPQVEALIGIAVPRSARHSVDLLNGNYPIWEQMAFNAKVAAVFGFDFEAGRIDTTAHPFCSGLGPEDCRLTTRYDEKNFLVSLYAVMHEAGHGLYEQGLPKEFFGLPRGMWVSLGIHESQSRFWENRIGRGLEFWDHWLPVACEHFPHLKKLTPEQMYAAVNRAEKSLIRVEADEVTYDLHIILRFELEMRMIRGELKVEDLPKAWNEEFEKMMGVKVPNDAQGCLQDIHWSMGSMGYFATYTLGNLNASQLYCRMLNEDPMMLSDLKHGNYVGVLLWLREKIHQHGKRYRSVELMEKATGEAPQIRYHLDCLKKKVDTL